MTKAASIEELRAQIQAIVGSGAKSSSSQNEKKDAPSLARKKNSKLDPSSAEDALSKIVALVNVSERSEKTIRERLGQVDFNEPAIEEAVARAKTYGFIDDMRFAATLIRSRLNQGKGIAGIRRELLGHDIEISQVPGWPDEFEVDENDELTRALALLERKSPHSKNLRDGAYRKLIAKGYSSSTASAAARMWAESQTKL